MDKMDKTVNIETSENGEPEGKFKKDEYGPLKVVVATGVAVAAVVAGAYCVYKWYYGSKKAEEKRIELQRRDTYIHPEDYERDRKYMESLGPI